MAEQGLGCEKTSNEFSLTPPACCARLVRMPRFCFFAAAALLAVPFCFAQPSPAGEELPKARTLFVIGDGSAKTDLDQGWGDHLSTYFVPDLVRISNRAQPGASAESFLADAAWKSILAELQEGDIVFIQFGRHEDSSVTGAANFEQSLLKFIEQTRAAKATPILLTPTVTNIWKDGKLVGRSNFEKVILSVASSKKVDLADVASVEEEALEEIGQVKAASYFSTDPYRTSPAGADFFAGCVMEALRRAGSQLTEQNPFMIYAFFKTMRPLTTEAVTEFNWQVNQKRLTEVAHDIAGGGHDYSVLKDGGRGTEISLPAGSKYLSDGDTVFVWRDGKDSWTLFFTFKGVLDSFAGFVYATNGKIPPADAFLGNPIEIIKMAPNWYWYSSKN